MVRIFVGVLALGLLLVSCREKEPERPLVLPETPLFDAEGVGYGVVNVSFALVLKALPPAAPESAGIIRKGGVVRVVERRAAPASGTVPPAPAARTGPTSVPSAQAAGAAAPRVAAPGTVPVIWALVEARGAGVPPGGTPVRGWVPDESVDFYDNPARAETAALLMLR
jgi:hypothetical protein